MAVPAPAAQHARPVVVRAGDVVRGTQSFVQVMAAVWRQPVLTALEVAWRWVFGAGALWLLWTAAQGVYAAAVRGDGGGALPALANTSWANPMAASVKVGEAMAVLLPPALAAARWVLPLLFAGWVLLSTAGRVLVLRRLDPALRPRFVPLAVLNAIRVLFLGGALALWFAGLTWAGAVAITGPGERGEEANLVLYFALVIGQTLLLFVAWAAVSWILSIAPVAALMRGTGVAASLRAAWHIGPLRSKLVEINLVMGIVKVALVVLAMVFSASPLPFQTVETDGFLHVWWAGVTLWYLLASDYFHVVRLAACLALWRAYEVPEPATSVVVV